MNANNLRQLDAEVAERVMGFQPCRCSFVHAVISPPPPRCASCGRPLSPPYSSDISAAFQVVERMRELGWEVEVDSHSEPSSTWRVRFEPRKHETTSLANRVWAATIEWDASLPLAICKAALDALSNSLMKV